MQVALVTRNYISLNGKFLVDNLIVLFEGLSELICCSEEITIIFAE
jgi:hypothetical protein